MISERQITAVLFADIKGYSSLPDDAQLRHVRNFLDCSAKANTDGGVHFLYKTAGDGVLMCSSSPSHLAELALRLRDAVRTEESDDADIIDRFLVYRADVRVDERINKRILDLVREYGAKSVVIADGSIGCPHEEGTDYPKGEECPECPFWHGKDRFG